MAAACRAPCSAPGRRMQSAARRAARVRTRGAPRARRLEPCPPAHRRRHECAPNVRAACAPA
eukprot:scaffold62827_cov90-Phaeocystis_antarctica.AAC.1